VQLCFSFFIGYVALYHDENSGIRARKDLEEWLNRVGLPDHSPHKFRHGHAVYALKMAKDISALKAVSQNLMHANLSVTDGVYGILSETDVRKQMAMLGDFAKSNVNDDDIFELLESLLAQRKKSISKK